MTRRFVSLMTAAAAVLLLTPAAAQAATGYRTLKLRNGQTLQLPDHWKVYGKGDWIRVVTGRCAKPEAPYGTPECVSFWVLGPKAIKVGNEAFRPYTGKHPFYPATDVQPCPHDDRWGQAFTLKGRKGLAPVGDRTALYRAWNFRCVNMSNGKTTKKYVQREWYLPKSKILILDQFATPGLAGVLKNAG
ncbi:hypothetical protein [Thermoactinospora rubra]|uniref:hypothetical protein n=1 Tax=Thermoactinospora rubra TaxID=1088767 RepID=UPI000A116683|nr:hypothetical protein [Thermoactinospora rubra]